MNTFLPVATKLLCGLFLVFMFGLSVSHAAIEIHEFNDAQTEEDYKNLIAELRCLVCQNQNLAGSDADLAKDLRQQTYEMLQQGNSKQQVIDYMVARYGDFVLYRPPLKSSTYLLWAGPFVLLLLVLLVVFFTFSKKRSAEAIPQPSQLDKAKKLLEQDESGAGK